MLTEEVAVSNRLSYSQIRLYSECGMRYKFHYVDRLRETTKSGALFFGTAIDKSLEHYVNNPSASVDDVLGIFDKSWTRQDINGRDVYLPDSTLVVYAQSDIDFDLLRTEDMTFLGAKRDELVPELEGTIQEVYAECAKFKKQRAHRKFKETENKFLNLCNWLSLRRKGHLMIEAYKKHIAPKITKVIGTQVKVELANSDGDKLIGYADLVVHWEGGEEPVVLDFKTSSIEYDIDAVLTSPQLTIYAHALNVRRAGYVVFRKGILKNKTKICSVCSFDGTGSRAKTCTDESTGKRCGGVWTETIKPEVDIQILIDEIPVRTEEIILENIEAVNKAISNKTFVRNFNSCHGSFGACPYLNLCYKNSKDGLEQV